MRHLVPCSAVVAAALLSAPALAQYASDFESLTASAAGTVLTGQDGYYLPAGSMSVDFLAYTYAGNALGVPANPGGGDVFIAGTGPGSPTFARAQRDLTWGSGSGAWTVGFDILARFEGLPPTAQNLGSVSVQPFPGSQSFIALATWTDVNTAANWDANYVWFDAAGAQLTEAVADPGFQNLTVGHWYRWETDIDLTTNRILEVRIIDLATNSVATNNPVDRYMEGGTLGSATPTGFRFFAGGGVAGNTLAFDNPAIFDFTPPCADLEVTTGAGTVTFDLTGAAPGAPAVLMIARYEGETPFQVGVLGEFMLGLAQPILPRMMGVTDGNGDVSLTLRLPPGLPPVLQYAQAMSIAFQAPPPGPPSIEFCVSDVEGLKTP